MGMRYSLISPAILPMALAGFIPNMIYIPDEGFVGQDTFTFVVFDGIVNRLRPSRS